MSTLDQELKQPINSRMYTCPAQGKWTSFQLVDEFGDGTPYGGLAYDAIDTEGHLYKARLDFEGKGKVENHFAGPITITLKGMYQGKNDYYNTLASRDSYPLPITELQVRAERTRFANKDGKRTHSNPAQACADFFCQVEVRHLVEHVAHLPAEVECHFRPNKGWARLMREHGKRGVCLLPGQHSVLEVRALRALRPMLSTDSAFCALNLYQLAIMATLSYNPFGQEPEKAPIREKQVSYPLVPSVGNWFGDALAKFKEVCKVDPKQENDYYPLYEEVAYSKRLEIVPFDPDLYPANSPDLGKDQQHPASIHFLDDREHTHNTDTQAFITHNDELILISVRGTNEKLADYGRDADALLVPFTEGEGKVHRGFYEAAQKAYSFTVTYLEMFYTGQKLVICGHSLGGSITLLLSEMLRRRQGFNYNIVLYTYGAPRAADATFVKAAAELTHYRMVNHNDPVPSVPGTWMDTNVWMYGAGVALTFVNVPVGLTVFTAGITNLNGEPYEHHGHLSHFFPVVISQTELSTILWEPGCDTLKQQPACSLALQKINGLPHRPGLLTQLFGLNQHSMVGAYIPASWATLRRWQESLEFKLNLITELEFQVVDRALETITQQIRRAEYSLPGLPDRRKELANTVTSALLNERYNVIMTRERLATLRVRAVNATDVYGRLAEDAEALAEALMRWQAHPENLVVERMAMAPGVREDRRFAKREPIDLNSMV